MKIIKRKNFYYLGHSFRKEGKVIYRERYLGKEIPENIEEIKENFLRECFQEDIFKKLKIIKNNFNKEWKKFPESIKKKSLLDLAIEFTYNTNAIEGSTVTLDETEDLVKRKISPHKSLIDVQETLNHVQVFFKVLNEKNLSLKIILKWHKDLFQETKSDIAGKIRDYLVRVGSYLAPDWQDLDKLIREFFFWYNKNKKVMNPVELAARAHYKFEKIHPFGDGNGRVGRLIIAHILMKSNCPLLIVEYKKRKSYYRALSKSENGFVTYFMRRYLKVNQRYLK